MNKTQALAPRIPLMILAIALLIAFYRLILGEVFVWGLPTLQFYPWRLYALDLLGSGQLPLWNPYNGAGAPLFANYQSALLYPLNWLSFFLATPWMMSVIAVIHLFIAGWGMWAFTGRLGYGTLGRGLSALGFGMTSYLVARLGTFPIISAAAWLPWLMWAAHGLVKDRRRIDAAWLASFTALLLLAGHAQTAWYSLLLTAIYVLWQVLSVRPIRWQSLLAVGVALVLGAGIAGLQLAATGDLLLQSHRSSGVDYDAAMNFSYSPLKAFNFIAPNLIGNPGEGSYLANDVFFEDAVYIGLIPLVSAVAAVIGWIRGQRARTYPTQLAAVPFWLAIVIFAFILALGRNTPIFPFLYEHVPTFSLFQAPVRWHLWTVFGLCMLAGAGATVWGRTRRAKRWAGRLTAASIAALIAGSLSPVAMEAGHNVEIVTLLRGLFSVGLIGTAAGMLSLIQPDPSHARYARWSLAILMLVAADLGWASVGLNPTHTAAYTLQPEPTASPARAYWPEAVQEHVKFDTWFQPDDYRVVVNQWQEVLASELPDLNILDRLPLLNNFDPLRIGHFELFSQRIEAAAEVDERLFVAANVGSRYSMDGTRAPLDIETARAWLVSDCLQAADDSIPGDWQPATQVLLHDAQTCPNDTATGESTGKVLAIDDSVNEVAISVEVEQPGWLVLADTFYPGWKAEVNGTPTPIERANIAFRAVAVTPDARTVRFVYQPDWLLPGVLVSLVSLLALLVLFRSGGSVAGK